MSEIRDCLGSPIPDFHPKRDGQVQDDEHELVITTIQATNVAVGLKRIPAGFYIAVWHSGLEWQTPNKPVSLNNDVIEWGGPIPIPSDLSAAVRLEIFASFEFQPMLGQGEALRELTVTVQQLLDRNERGLPFAFPQTDGDVRSPCSSFLVTVQRQRRASVNSSGSRVLEPHRSITEPLGQLEEATNEGHRALSRYRKQREIRDLERSIQLFEHALNNCPLDHPYCAAAQSNLAMAIFTRCQADDSDRSLDAPIALYHDALAVRPTGHPDRPSTLIQLAAVHFARFERQQDALDASHAVTFLREAMDLSSAESHENQAAITALRRHAVHALGLLQAGGSSSKQRASASSLTDNNPWILDLSVLFLHRFEHFGDIADLQQAILVLEASISDQGHRDPVSLGNLGVALLYRFSHIGQLDDLEQAIRRQKDAVRSTPDGHPDKPRHLNHLGNTFLTRFECLGELIDLEQAILRHKEAVNLNPNNYPDKPSHLNNLATSFRTRFVHLNELSDLEEAISVYREVIDLTLDGNRNKPACLNNLAISFSIRFRHLNELNDLEEATSVHRKAIEITPDGDRKKPTYLNNLATSLVTRFRHLGELSDLEEAISKHTKAVELVPTGHPIKPKYLNDLANSFRTRFECLGKLSDLEQAISGNQKAVELAGPNRNDHVYLNSLSTSLLTRSKHLGEPSDLEEAISGYKKAIELTPDGNRNKPAYLNDLAMSFLTRFEWLGKLDDLEQAISGLREAVELAPAGHPDKPRYLSNLAVCLRTRFTHAGQQNDLKEAISKHEEAVQLAPVARRTSKLNCRKNVVARSGQRSSEQSDLEQAISRYRDAVRLTSDRHPDKYSRLNNLANCLLVRFEHVGELSDLEEAAVMYGNAVRLKNVSSSTGATVACANLSSSNPRDRGPPNTETHPLAPTARRVGGQMIDQLNVESDYTTPDDFGVSPFTISVPPAETVYSNAMIYTLVVSGGVS